MNYNISVQSKRFWGELRTEIVINYEYTTLYDLFRELGFSHGEIRTIVRMCNTYQNGITISVPEIVELFRERRPEDFI